MYQRAKDLSDKNNPNLQTVIKQHKTREIIYIRLLEYYNTSSSSGVILIDVHLDTMSMPPVGVQNFITTAEGTVAGGEDIATDTSVINTNDAETGNPILARLHFYCNFLNVFSVEF